MVDKLISQNHEIHKDLPKNKSFYNSFQFISIMFLFYIKTDILKQKGEKESIGMVPT